MVKHKIFVVGLLALSFALIWGCSDRSTEPDQLTYDRSRFTFDGHVFFDELVVQVGNNHQLQPFSYYLPEVALDMNHPVPLLVLLAPEGEDEQFYVHHGLMGLYHEMLAKGEIEDMAIVTLPPEGIAQVFGGYFYAGHGLPAGKYDDIMGGELWEFLVGRWQILIDSQSKRGIGGIGMGAYGAFRAALRNPGFWGSVSGADGPLDFDGADGNSGLIALMDSVFVEQPNLTQANFRTEFDSSRTNPISRLFCGGSLTFSPHDQNLEDLVIVRVFPNPERLNITLDEDLRGTVGYIIMDSTTLVENVMKQDVRNMDFHLPFSYDDRPYRNIWGLWEENNLERLYTGSQFANTDVWIGTSEDAKWGYHDMTMSWASTLGDNIVDELYQYSGTDSRPATGNQYVYDLMRKMLKFHSDSFNK